MKQKTPLIDEQNRKKIFWNLINSFLVFAISLGSAIVATSFDWTWKGFGVAIIFGLLTAIIKFKDFWEKEQPEYSQRILELV